MNYHKSFQLSMYLFLAISCLNLCVSEYDFLPEIPILAGVAFSLLIAAFFLEGRWSLSLKAANLVGIILIAIMGIWVAMQFFRPTSDGMINQLPWPTRLLPYLGPILLLLIPAKLYRTKEIADYWAMYSLGLITMALASALAADGIFGLLLVIWFLFLVWSLILFYFHREKGNAFLPSQEPLLNTHIRQKRNLFTGRAVLWGSGILLFAFFSFLLTPRNKFGTWQMRLGQQIETGISADKQIDLNREGVMQSNEDIVAEVRVTNINNQPKNDLDPNSRWRAFTLDLYDHGKWLQDREKLYFPLVATTRTRPTFPNRSKKDRLIFDWMQVLPDYGMRSHYFIFSGIYKDVPPILFDPVYWVPGKPVPVVSSIPEKFGNISGGWRHWHQFNDSSFSATQEPANSNWIQVSIFPHSEELGPTLYFEDNNYHTRGVTNPILTRILGLPSLQRWTDNLISQLVIKGKLPPEVEKRSEARYHRDREYHEIIARVLSDYLTNSGDFYYSNTLNRINAKIDPVEDFLYNLKAGHCERFATALVMMLRSQDIPARLVVGFKGCDLQSNGHYVIRQSHAHTWVEALISRKSEPDAPPPPPSGNTKSPKSYLAFHWLSLDPTSNYDRILDNKSSKTWWQEAQNQSAEFFNHFVLSYNQKVREETKDAFFALLTRIENCFQSKLFYWIGVAGCLLLVFCLFLIQRRRYRRKQNSSISRSVQLEQPSYLIWKRLLSLLAPLGHVPSRGQTPLEFAMSVHQLLQQKYSEKIVETGNNPPSLLANTRLANTDNSSLGTVDLTIPVAEIPLWVANWYYQLKYNQQEYSTSKAEECDQLLNQLEKWVHLQLRPSLTNR